MRKGGAQVPLVEAGDAVRRVAMEAPRAASPPRSCSPSGAGVDHPEEPFDAPLHGVPPLKVPRVVPTVVAAGVPATRAALIAASRHAPHGTPRTGEGHEVVALPPPVTIRVGARAQCLGGPQPMVVPPPVDTLLEVVSVAVQNTRQICRFTTVRARQGSDVPPLVRAP